MLIHNFKLQQSSRVIASLLAITLLTVPAAASAVAVTPSTSGMSTLSTTQQQQHLAAIIARGNQEITRRLAQLAKLSTIITNAKHITAANKTTLTSQVSAEVTGLTALKTKLDAETTLAAAITDAQSIVTDYRVYALVTPKVWLIKTADDQQTVEDKLTALITKFQTRINAAKSQGKEVTALQTVLDDMTAKTKAAQAISSGIETKVLPLQPTDFDSDHTILSGDYAQLKTAHTDNEAAYADAKTLVTDLTSL